MPGDGSLGHGAHGSPGAALCQETGAGATAHVTVPELPRALVAGAGATRHMVALKLPCARRHESWDTSMCARLVFRLDLDLVRGGIRSSGYRHIYSGI
jgi:hypothetical protein